jgi:SM-20-related protein
VTKIDAQATLYRPADFLTTMHDDTGAGERLAAYTLGLTARMAARLGRPAAVP